MARLIPMINPHTHYEGLKLPTLRVLNCTLTKIEDFFITPGYTFYIMELLLNLTLAYAVALLNI